MRSRLRDIRRDPTQLFITASAIALSLLCGWLVVYVSTPRHVDDAPPLHAAVATTAAAAVRSDVAPALTTTEPVATAPRTAPAPTPARQDVRVRVDASANPTFLCVEDGEGNSLYGGILDQSIVFIARHLRLNVGLGTTRITVNGRAVKLVGSPAGLDVTPTGGARPLAENQRPCG